VAWALVTLPALTSLPVLASLVASASLPVLPPLVLSGLARRSALPLAGSAESALGLLGALLRPVLEQSFQTQQSLWARCCPPYLCRLPTNCGVVVLSSLVMVQQPTQHSAHGLAAALAWGLQASAMMPRQPPLAAQRSLCWQLAAVLPWCWPLRMAVA